MFASTKPRWTSGKPIVAEKNSVASPTPWWRFSGGSLWKFFGAIAFGWHQRYCLCSSTWGVLVSRKEGGCWMGCWGLDSMKVGGGRTLAWCFFLNEGKVGLIDINDFSCRLEETKRNMSGSTTYSYLFCELWWFHRHRHRDRHRHRHPHHHHHHHHYHHHHHHHHHPSFFNHVFDSPTNSLQAVASNCPVLQQLAVMLPETDTDVAMKAEVVKEKLVDLSLTWATEKKNLGYFPWSTGCLMGILIVVCNPHITG